MALPVGEKAPAFKFRDSSGQVYTNEDFLGKRNLVVAFYVLAFTGG